MAVKYRFNPYAPQYVKVPKAGETLDDKEKVIKSLESQRANLDERLAGLGKERDNRTLIQKALNLKPDAGIFMNFLDLVNRPVEAVKGLVSARVDDDATTEPLTEFKRGLSGERGFTSPVETIFQYTMNLDLNNLSPVQKLALDIGGDILFDPLTYVPAGTFLTIGKKALGIGSKTIPKQVIKNALAARQVYLKAAKKGGKFAAQAIKTVEQMDDILKAAKAFIKKGKLAAGVQGEIAVKEFYENYLKKLAKKAGLADDALVVVRQGDELVEGTARKLKDLGVFVKYTDPTDNITRFIRVAEVETKTVASMFKRGLAYATNTRIAIDDIKRFIDGGYKKLRTTKKSNLGTKLLNEIGGLEIGVKQGKKTVFKKIADVLAETGDPNKIFDLLSQGGKNAVKFADNASKEAIETSMRNLFFKDLELSGVNYIAFRYGPNLDDVATLSLESAKKYTRISQGKLTPIVKKGIANGKNLSQAFEPSIIGAKKLAFSNGAIQAKTLAKAVQSGTVKSIKTGKKIAAKKGRSFIKLATDGTSFDDLLESIGKVVDDGTQTLKIEDIHRIDDLNYYVEVSAAMKKGGAGSQFLSQLDIVDTAGKKITKKAQYEAFDETETFFDSILRAQESNVETVSLLDRLARTETAVKGGVAIGKADIPFITGGADALRSGLNVVKKAFNKGFEFTTDQIRKMARIFGKNENIMSEFSGRLAKLTERAKSLGFTEEEITKIVESGAKLIQKGVDPNGLPVWAIDSIRKYSPEEILVNVYINVLDNAEQVFLPGIKSKIQRQNLETILNKAYKNVVGKSSPDGLKIISKVNKKTGKTAYAVGFTDEFNAKLFAPKRRGALKKILDSNANYADFAKKIDFGAYDLGDDLIRKWGNTNGGQELIEGFQGVRDDLVNILKDELGFAEMSKMLEGKQGYLRHILTKDALEKQATKALTDTSRYTADGLDLLQNRKYLGTTDEINQAFEAFHKGVDSNVFDMNIQKSMEDLIQVTGQRLEQHQTLQVLLKQSDKLGRSFIQTIDDTEAAARVVAKDFKVLGKNFKDEFRNLFAGLDPRTKEVLDSYLKNMGYKKGKKLIIQNAAYEFLSQVDRAYLELPSFIKGYDKFLNTWKSVTLVSPGYHLRNLLGNSTNSYLAGMGFVQQTRYAKRAFTDFGRFKTMKAGIANLTPQEIAQRISQNIGKGLNDVERAKAIKLFRDRLTFTGQLNRPATWSVDDLVAIGFDRKQTQSYKFVQEFMESGASQSHRGVRDLESVKRYSQTGKKSITKEVVRMNYNLAEAADDYQRYMLYTWAYDKSLKGAKGLNAAEAILKAQNDAATKVAEALFDYSHLTNFEKRYMKRLFPFYTFFKNNLVFQAKNIIKDPGRYARLGRAYKGAVEAFGGMELEDMPDYMRENMWLPLPIKVRKDDKESIAFLKSNLPLSDFLQFVENPFREGANFITTPVKLFFEFGTGREVFTGREIERTLPRAENGVMPYIRGADGTLSFQSGAMQKFAQDMGLRVPMNYASVFLDLLDTATGSQSFGEGTTDFFKRMGLIGVQTQESLQLSALYQQLEQLRNQRKDFEARTGQKLPPKQRKKKQQMPDIPGLDEYLRGLGG